MGFGGSGFGSLPFGSGLLGSPPLPPPVSVPTLLTGSDTFRGGGVFSVLSGDQLANTSRDTQFNALTLPTGWTAEGDGTATPATNGVVLQTRPATGSTAALRTPDTDYVRFDATVDVAALLPVDDPGAAVEVVALEHDLGGGRVVRIGLRRGLGTTPDDLVAFGEITIGGVTTDGGARPVTTGTNLALQLVRNGPLVWGLVGVRDPRSLVFSSLDLVLEGTVNSTDPGPLRVTARNLTTTAVARARVTAFRVEPHVTINDRLVVDKAVASRNQLRGIVPAATVFEVGFARVDLFGLFGVESSDTSFVYTTPEPRTLGNEVTRTLITYTDPILRDT